MTVVTGSIALVLLDLLGIPEINSEPAFRRLLHHITNKRYKPSRKPWISVLEGTVANTVANTVAGL